MTATITAAGLVFALQSCASDWSMDVRAREFLLQQIGGREAVVTIHQASAKLPSCREAEFFLPYPDRPLLGRTTVGVRCLDQGGRTRYLQANISITGAYLTASRAISAGEVLDSSMLAVQRGDLAQLPRHAIADESLALGMQVIRPVPRGAILQSSALRQVLLIERNARVRISASGTGFTISREAVALEGGGMGATVRVKTDSGEIVRAKVTGKNALAVPL